MVTTVIGTSCCGVRIETKKKRDYFIDSMSENKIYITQLK